MFAPIIALTRPSDSICVKGPCNFTGKPLEVRAFLDKVQNNLCLQQQQITIKSEQSLFQSLYLANEIQKIGIKQSKASDQTSLITLMI